MLSHSHMLLLLFSFSLNCFPTSFYLFCGVKVEFIQPCLHCGTEYNMSLEAVQMYYYGRHHIQILSRGSILLYHLIPLWRHFKNMQACKIFYYFPFNYFSMTWTLVKFCVFDNIHTFLRCLLGTPSSSP